MPGRSALVAPMIVILAGALAADCAWARGRGGGHGGGKRGGGAHAGATAGGGARAAHVGTASGGGARMARANSSTAGGAPAAGGGASAGALHAGGVRLALGAGVGGLLALGAFPRIDGRFYGIPPPRTGAAVGIAAFWEVPPPNYPAPVVVVPYHPSEYIEMAPDAPVVAPPKNYWYFCPDAGGYYPYVEECPEGWELVAPPGAVPIG